jgi:hypothetical protein
MGVLWDIYDSVYCLRFSIALGVQFISINYNVLMNTVIVILQSGKDALIITFRGHNEDARNLWTAVSIDYLTTLSQ